MLLGRGLLVGTLRWQSYPTPVNLDAADHELERRLWELEAATGGRRSIAVVIPEDVDVFVGAEEIAEAVAAKGKNARLVRVLSASEVNGLEFDHVVVVEPAAIVGASPLVWDACTWP